MSTKNTKPALKTSKPGRSPRGPPRLTTEQALNSTRAKRALPADNNRSTRYEEPPMQLELYQALVAINVPQAAATELVRAIDEHIEARVKTTTEPLMAKLASTEALLMQTQQGHYNTLAAKIDGIAAVKTEGEKQADQRRQRLRWVVATVIATVPATVGLLTGLKALGIWP